MIPRGHERSESPRDIISICEELERVVEMMDESP